MKISRLLVLCGLLVLGACAQEQVKPEGAQAPAGTEGAQTSGAQQQAPQGAVTGEQPAPATPSVSEPIPAAKRLVHFAFDSSAIDDENRAIVEANAQYINAHPNATVNLQGHTDERGTREYNLALGDRRAKAIERMLRVLGVPADRIKTVSYGEEKPVATGDNEAAWAQNRRVEFVYK